MSRPKAPEPRVQVTLKVPLSVYDAIASRASLKGFTWHAFIVGSMTKTFGRTETPSSSSAW